MSWKHGNNFSKVHASTFNNWNTIWLVSWETHIKNILFQSMSEVKVQPHVDKPPRTSWSTYWGVGWQANCWWRRLYIAPKRYLLRGKEDLMANRSSTTW
jgi:hypothetical protein